MPARRIPARRLLPASAVLVTIGLLLAACTGLDTSASAPTEAALPAATASAGPAAAAEVPTLPPTAEDVTATPGGGATDAATPGSTEADAVDGPATAAGEVLAPPDLDVADIAGILREDPERAGARGPDLLDELERVLDRPGDDERIDRAIRRTERWVADGELDAEVGVAAVDALAALRAEPGRGDGGDGRGGDGGGDDDDDDGDDDDD